VISSFTPHAPGGADVTIEGSGFSTIANENVVTINGKATTVSGATAIKLTIKVPAKAGSGLIGVTVNTKSATTTTDFTYDWQAVVTTLAGSGGTVGQFNHPTAVAVDKNGNVYVADYNNNRIRKITAAGEVSTFAGSGTAGYAEGTGTAAQFNRPYDIAVDTISGNVYVADFSNNRIRKITAAGVVTTFAGSGLAGSANGTGTAAQVHGPSGVAVDGNGNVYVTAFSGHQIRKITAAGEVSTLAGSGTAGNTDGTGIAAQFNNPVRIAVDGSGNVYVADRYNHSIRKITATGVVTTLAGSNAGYADATGTAARFNMPNGIAADVTGNVYVGELDNHRIRRISPAGVVTTLAGSGTAGSADGTGAAAQFNTPAGIVIDRSGNLYVADESNQKIRKITLQ
jgi:DNA-binding beta-propeller fold protein YncE